MKGKEKKETGNRGRKGKQKRRHEKETGNGVKTEKQRESLSVQYVKVNFVQIPME